LESYENFLLLGIGLGLVALIRIFSAAVDGTRPRLSVLFLFVAIGMIYYSGRLAGRPLSANDVTTALAKLFAELTS
jgi:hypothetical protein